MKNRFFNPAMVIACLALGLSLGGTAYAVTRLPANSVGSRQVVDSSLLRRDFHAGVLAITGRAFGQGRYGVSSPREQGRRTR